jgi:Icc protein
MLFAHISDLHVMPKGVLAYGRVDSARMLKSAVAHLNRLSPRPDAVLISGDLASHGEPAAYVHMREILSDLDSRYFVIPGNHDDVSNFRHAFGDHGYLPREGKFINYAVDEFAVRVVALDSIVHGRVRGAVCDERLEWLDRTLAARPFAPTLVMMHHAPISTGLAHIDGVGMEGSEALEQVIARHPQVERVLCGHVHRAIVSRFGGTVLASCPSTAHQASVDLRPDGEDTFIMEPPGFQLHRWNGKVLHTYTLAIGEFDGPFPYH